VPQAQVIWVTDQFSSAIGSIRVAAAHKSSDISVQFIAQDELYVVTVAHRLFGIVSSDSTFLVAFHVDHAAVNINGNRFQFFLSQQLFEDLEVDFSQHVGCFAAEVSQKVSNENTCCYSDDHYYGNYILLKIISMRAIAHKNR